LQDGSDVLLRRVDEIAAHEVAELLRLVDRHRAASSAGLRSSFLAVTVDRARAPAAVRASLDRTGPAARTEAVSARPERIPGLVKEVLERVDPDRRHTVSPAALQALTQWDWPGNITELVETLERVVREAPASVIQCRNLPRHLQQASPRRQVGLLEAAEREAIIRALDSSAGNKSEAAGLLGIGRTTLYRRIRQLGLDGYEGSL
jgi:transcriptional regulator with AAA-type ATPase domain